MYTTTRTRIDRYHLREDRIYFDDYPNISTIFLSTEWFEDFSTPVPVSFWEEVAEKFTHGHNSVIFLKIFEKVFSNTNGNGESVDLHGSSLWMNLDELRRGVHWYISRIEPQDGINIR